MIAHDADILTLLMRGDPICLQNASLTPADEQSITIVTAEEILRGRLHAIRQAQAGKGTLTVDETYRRFERTLVDLRALAILSYSAQAEALVQAWRQQKIKVGISDMRIAATCIANTAKLISRNRRDFDLMPGLTVEYW
jgi:tRNA(fMet)-specific endonuclease VapC